MGKRNPFYARPEHFHGRVTRGVASHPGFHTGCSMEIAQCYAQIKVSDELPSSWEEETLAKPMGDYPVIVELDMLGMPFVPDYDAEEWFREAALGAVQYSESFEDLDSSLEYDDSETDIPSNMTDALFYLSGQQPKAAVYRLRNWLQEQADPEAAYDKIKSSGALPPKLLAEISCQFRYMDDVPAGRIVNVYYMKPVYDHLFPYYEDPEWEEGGYEDIIARIEAAGYDTVSMGNVLDENPVLTEALTVNVAPTLWKPHKKQRLEFHGTSYRNLLLAAPGLAHLLPEPPWPYSSDAESRENPPKLGTVWAARAKIKIQDDSVFPPRWKTLAECMDTPNAVAACIERENLRGDLWVFGEASGRQYLGRR